MATHAHCAYVFECLAASFDRRPPLSLAHVEELWAHFHADAAVDSEAAPGDGDGDGEDENENEDDADMTDVDADADADEEAPRPAAISRLLNRDSSATSSSSSLPSTSTRSAASTPSQRDTSGAATPASSTTSSRSNLFSFARRKKEKREAHPLFVTWNTVSKAGHKSLRGCIGTFEAQELEAGLKSYALTSAFEDIRFQPIPSSLLPSLSTDVTLLTNFSRPTHDPLDWKLGTHGIRISFTSNGRRFGATYLPDVAPEQGWTKEETLISLMRKAGWDGSSSSWQRVWQQGKGELVRYEGARTGLGYREWREWREWVGAGREKST